MLTYQNQYFLFVKTKEDDYPKFVNVCNDLEDVNLILATIAEYYEHPDGFDSLRKLNKYHNLKMKELSEIINDKSYSDKDYSHQESVSVISKFAITDATVTYDIKNIGLVIIAEKMIFH